jgi:pimeloyl-ACP methyl ester carboxylesterase
MTPPTQFVSQTDQQIDQQVRIALHRCKRVEQRRVGRCTKDVPRDLGHGHAPYIGSLLDSITRPIVLVAHSMGGTVITNAAAGKSNVKALVYIAAFVPDVGETQGELITKSRAVSSSR